MWRKGLRRFPSPSKDGDDLLDREIQEGQFFALLVLEQKQLVHSRAHQGSFADSRETVFEEQYEMRVRIIWRREGNPPLRIRHTLSLYGISGCIEQNGRDVLYAFARLVLGPLADHVLDGYGGCSKSLLGADAVGGDRVGDRNRRSAKQFLAQYPCWLYQNSEFGRSNCFGRCYSSGVSQKDIDAYGRSTECLFRRKPGDRHLGPE